MKGDPNSSPTHGGLQELYAMTDEIQNWADIAAFEQLCPIMGCAPLHVDEVLEEIANQVKAALEGRLVLHSSNSFILRRRKTHFLRANFWRPSKRTHSFRADEVRLYAYGLPHDHDFDLLTVGLIGSGYRTTLFRYDGPKAWPELPAAINSEAAGEFVVGRGDVLFMERNRDIHIQHPPSESSMTLNVMSALRGDRKGQFIFDATAAHAIAVPENYSARFIGLIELLLSTGQGALVPEMIAGIHGGFDAWMLTRINELLEMIEREGDADLAGFWREECARKIPNVVV